MVGSKVLGLLLAAPLLLVGCSGEQPLEGDSDAADVAPAATASPAETGSTTEPSRSPDDETVAAELSPLQALWGFRVFDSVDDEIAHNAAVHRDIQEAVLGCMRASGFEYQPEPFYTGEGDGSGQPVIGSKPGFGYYESVEFALYLNGSDGLIDTEAPNGEYLDSLDEPTRDAWVETMFACDEEARRVIDPQPVIDSTGGDDFDLGLELGLLEDRIANDPRLATAWIEWSRCMAEQGFRFEHMEAIHQELDARLRPFDDVLLSGASVLPPDLQTELDELTGYELLVHDAEQRCRSTVAETERLVRWELEEDFIEEHGLSVD